VDEGHTATVSLTPYGSVTLVGSTSGLKNGDIFYVEGTDGPPGVYLMQITRDDSQCYSTAGEFTFYLELDQESQPFSFDGNPVNNINRFLPPGAAAEWYQSWSFRQTLWGFSLRQGARVTATTNTYPRTVVDTHEVSHPYYVKTRPEGQYTGCVKFSLNANVIINGALTAVAGINIFSSGISQATFTANIQVTGFRSFAGAPTQTLPAITADATNSRVFSAVKTVSVSATMQWTSEECIAGILDVFTVHYVPRLEHQMSGNGMNLGFAPSGFGQIETGGIALKLTSFSLIGCP